MIAQFLFTKKKSQSGTIIILCKNYSLGSPAFLLWQWPKSLYRSRAGRHFYGTKNVICAGFGPIGNTEKKKFLRTIFLMFSGAKFF